MTIKTLPVNAGIVTQETKECTYCGARKPRDQFSRCSRSRDGLQHNCRACQKVRRAGTACSVDGCPRAHLARGLCTHHWRIWRNAATAEDMSRRRFQDLQSAMDGRTQPGPGGCIVWVGNRSGYEPNQYGVLTFGGNRVYAHRAAYEIANGPIPDGMEVDHVCHNRLCVNANHLRLATHKQNAEHLAAAHSNSLTGVRGVTFDADRSQYRARVKHNYREIHVGRFDTIGDATQAAAQARRELFTHNNADRRGVA